MEDDACSVVGKVGTDAAAAVAGVPLSQGFGGETIVGLVWFLPLLPVELQMNSEVDR